MNSTFTEKAWSDYLYNRKVILSYYIKAIIASP